MPSENESELSALGKARERLYSSDEEKEAPVRGPLEGISSAIPHAWSGRIEALKTVGEPHHVRFASRFLLAALGFFVLAAGVSVFLFYTGRNVVSVDSVELSVQGPTTIAGGDTVPLALLITNRNPATIQDVTLEIDFPEGTRSAENVTLSYPRYIEDLDSLSPGTSVERSIAAVLFGGEGTETVIDIAVSFSTKRSNAVFIKRIAYPITISTAPLSVSLDTITETVSGKPFTIRATVRSNATQLIDNVVLQTNYPTGFTLIDSSIQPVGNNFPVGALEPGESEIVTLTGTLAGQDSEERVFRFTVGTGKTANDPSLAISYMTQEVLVRIAAPFLATSFTVNGSSAASPAVSPGQQVNIGVSWTNALAVPLSNAVIEIKIDGSALDSESVRTTRGFYRSSDRTIIFSRDTDPTLASLAPGSSGLGSFSFSTLSNAPRNSSIILTASIFGERIGQAGVPQQVTASASKTIKLVSAVTFSASSLHASGPFANTGPIPPVAEQETTYTIEWSVVNSGNDLADATVAAVLPAYVSFTGVTSPAGNAITYDSSSRTVTWRAGDISGSSSRQGAFQISLVPSTSQRGSSPALTTAPVFSAFDRFAQTEVRATGSAVTTETFSDSGYTATKGSVQ
jgi:hypothetical protein